MLELLQDHTLNCECGSSVTWFAGSVKCEPSLLMLSLSTDVDVVEPDEKSIVTYVSLLYDIFPNVPSLEQSLRDNVSFTCVLHSNEYLLMEGKNVVCCSLKDVNRDSLYTVKGLLTR